MPVCAGRVGRTGRAGRSGLVPVAPVLDRSTSPGKEFHLIVASLGSVDRLIKVSERNDLWLAFSSVVAK